MRDTEIPTLPDNAIEIKDLTKIYAARDREKAVKALDQVNLTIPRGSIFGLLGPNGAGKSTTINILAGLTIETAGTVKIWGFDLKQEMRMARASIGIVPQEVNLDAFFSPREVLEFQAGLYGVPKQERVTAELLKAMRLEEKADAYARSLSGGMKRRLLIAKALVHSPPVLVLDEPTAGVDVELRQQLWSYVKQLNSEGVTIVLTTHYLEEAQELCDQIAIINHGQVVACNDTPSLISEIDQRKLLVNLSSPIEKLSSRLSGFGGKLESPNQLVFNFSPSKFSAGEIISQIVAEDLEISDLISEESRLEDLFVRITGLDTHQAGSAGENDLEAGGASIARGKPTI